MKESYSQPVLIIQSFRVNDALMSSGGSSMECHTASCYPNGHLDIPGIGEVLCMAYNCDGGPGALVDGGNYEAAEFY